MSDAKEETCMTGEYLEWTDASGITHRRYPGDPVQPGDPQGGAYGSPIYTTSGASSDPLAPGGGGRCL